MEESFGTIMEFGVALAGFSAVAIALSHEPGALAPLDRFRALNLLSCALGGAFGGSLVLIGGAFGASGPTLWRATSIGVFAIVFGCTATAVLLRRWLAPEDQRRLSPTLWAVCVGGNLVLMVVQASNAAGVFGPPAPGPIMATLVWLLFFSAVLFVRLLVNRPGSSGS